MRLDLPSVERSSVGSTKPVRATGDEQTRPLPDDDLIADPVGTLTNAMIVHANPREVWAWLAQMGAGSRAGWYSYDVLDKQGLSGLRHRRHGSTKQEHPQ